jgi:plastocyanin
MRTIPLCLFLGLALTARAGEVSFLVKTAKGDVVPDAVVSLVPLDAPVPPVAADARVEIEQEGQEFEPFVTVVQAGTRVVFPNRDTVQHHVYSLSKAKKFELPLYNPGQKESVVFDVPGLVTVGCNIHDWMISHLVVVPTPWFAKSDAKGAATITAPAGRYRLELWHPRLAAPLTRELVVAEGNPGHEDFALTLKPDRRVRRPPGSKGAGY